MTDKFQIGEIAIYNRPESEYHNTEIEIIGPLEKRVIIDHLTYKKEYVPAYMVNVPGLGIRAARPQHLRKKRPPQNAREWFNKNIIVRREKQPA